MKGHVLRAFVKKEFLHIFRDYRTLMVLFGMPIAQVILFGYAITTELRDVKIGVWDMSKDQKSIELISNITSSEFFALNDNVSASHEIEASFKKGRVKAFLVFPNDFGNKLERGTASIQIIADASDPNTANIITNQLTSIIQRWDMLEKSKTLRRAFIDTEVRMHYNPESKSVLLFVPGVITIILMLVSAMLTSISIAREKEMGNMEILLVSPLKPAVVIIGKILPYLMLSLVNALIIMGIGNVVFEVPVNGSFVLLLLECLLFIVVALSLGVFISTKVESQQMALMMSLFALMLPTILLSGFIFPISSMPLPLQWISHAMPPKYFIIIIKAIMLKGVGIAHIWKETLILSLMAVFFIGLSVKNYKSRLE
ncbi:MAG TPA: multidrug ABC transporter permease [Flavobacteriales bacterium]|nr:multidrug ABC transporter permease [Flavobacteriales bacterium]